MVNLYGSWPLLCPSRHPGFSQVYTEIHDFYAWRYHRSHLEVIQKSGIACCCYIHQDQGNKRRWIWSHPPSAMRLHGVYFPEAVDFPFFFPCIQSSSSKPILCHWKRQPPQDACCPSFLSAIAGPCMIISGAILVDTFISQHLMDYM